MIIGVCGFGFSGSGAVLDWLKEYPEVFVYDKMEFSFIYKPDGLEDLGNAICYHPVRYFSSDSAIRRFIQYMRRMRNTYNIHTGGKFEKTLDKYLDNIIQIKWQGSTSVHSYQASSIDYIFRQRIPRIFWGLLNRKFNIVIRGNHWPQKEMYYSALDEDDFLRCSKEFVSGVIEAITENTNAKKIALDQCFTANDPEMSFKYFENPLAITVVRDPRDNYLLAKRALGYESSFIPRQNVDDFIIYYRGLMESRKNKQNNVKISEIKFEDLIYRTKETSEGLERMIGLPHIDVTCFKHFKPEVSINNTQLWLKYPQYKKDIEKIESELGDYLYPFEEFDISPNFTGRTF